MIGDKVGGFWVEAGDLGEGKVVLQQWGMNFDQKIEVIGGAGQAAALRKEKKQ